MEQRMRDWARLGEARQEAANKPLDKPGNTFHEVENRLHVLGKNQFIMIIKI
jgi:hypothetical protein